MAIQLILTWIDTRESLPEHFEYILFATLSQGKIMYGAWHKDHRRFYVSGGYYDLADVQLWARIPKTIQDADDKAARSSLKQQ